MTNKLYFKILIAGFALVLIFSGTSLAQTGRGKSKSVKKQKIDCSKVTDSQIALETNNQIKKIKAGFPRDVFVYVVVKNKVVTLRGSIRSKRAFIKITRGIKYKSCVRRVNNFFSGGCNVGDCPKQYKMCNGACIPCGETCN